MLVFDRIKIAEYHKKNQDKAKQYLQQGLSIVIDNTNIHCWECLPYVLAGKEVKAYGTVHGVPEEVVRAMKKEMEELTEEKVLSSIPPWLLGDEYVI